MRHTRPISVAPATTTDPDPDAIERFQEIFFFRVLVVVVTFLVRK